MTSPRLKLVIMTLVAGSMLTRAIIAVLGG